MHGSALGSPFVQFYRLGYKGLEYLQIFGSWVALRPLADLFWCACPGLLKACNKQDAPSQHTINAARRCMYLLLERLALVHTLICPATDYCCQGTDN